MCSVDTDTLEEDGLKFMPKAERFIFDKCNKCRNENPCILLRQKDCYCKTCFLANTVHKFKALLGKHRLIQPDDKVLVVHKVGHPSTALLHFLRTGLDLRTTKRLRFEPIFVYIDDQFYLNSDERQHLAINLGNQVRNFKFKIYFASVNVYLEKKNIGSALFEDPKYLSVKCEDILAGSLNQKCSTTIKENIIGNIRRKILLDTANFLGCKFVFSPEIALDIATDLLTNISLGRGQHVSLDTGFCDNRNPEVTILRPLKQFDMKELSIYNYFSAIEPVSVREYQRDAFSSVQSLMDNFIRGLQTNYPATVTTIVRTGDKLAQDENSISNIVCSFCQVLIENKSEELSSAEATLFSHRISTSKPISTVTLQDCQENLMNSSTDSNSDKYCYSCKKLLDYIKL